MYALYDVASTVCVTLPQTAQGVLVRGGASVVGHDHARVEAGQAQLLQLREARAYTRPPFGSS